MASEAPILFRPFSLDAANQRLLRGGRQVRLTPKAFAVLHFLVMHAGRLVTKTEFLEALWAGTHVQDSVLKVCIREIRRALSDPARSPRFIETMPRRGYRFVGRIGRTGRGHGRRAREIGCVGREAECAQMRAWLERALRGERQVVFVTGEAGIGKTAVVEAFLERSAGGPFIRVARGSCLEQYGAGEAYLPVLEALGRLSHQPGGTELAALLRRHAPTWLIQMPALISDDDRASLRREIIGATRERMLREMAEAMEALAAEAPIILVVEDLHWADYSTLDLISLLARRRGPARLLLIGTYRPADALLSHHPLEAVKQELLMRRRCHELRLDYLREAAVAEYLARRFPGAPLPGGVARSIHRRSGGNPLFMVNVVDSLVARKLLGAPDAGLAMKTVLREVETGMPENLRQMIAMQVDRLPRSEQALLEAASVAGLDFSALAIAAGQDADAPATEEACEAMARRGQFLRPTGVGNLPDGTVSARYAFIHPLYQNVLYQRIPPARRLRLHQRIAERGIAVYGSRVGEIAGELAVHFEQARDYRGAIHHLRAAAGNAARRFANREAIGHLTRAFGLVDHLPAAERGSLQIAILEQVGMVRRSMGDMHGAADDFEALVALAREQGRADAEARGLFYLGSALSWFDRPRFEAAAGQAMDLAGRLDDDLLRSHARGYAAYWNLLLRGPRAEDLGAPAEAIDAARRAGDRLLLGQHLSRASYFQCLRSEYRAGCEAAREGMELSLEVGDGFDYLLCHFFLAWGLLHRGQWGDMLSVLEKGIRMAERNDHQLWATLLHLEEALLYERACHFEEARRLCEQGLKRARDADHAHGQLVSQVLLGSAYLGLERYDRAQHCLGEVADPPARARILMDWSWQMPLGLCLSELELARGEPARARAEAERVGVQAGESGERTYRSLAWMMLAQISEAERDLPRAGGEITAALEPLEGVEAPVAEWQVCAAAAQIYEKIGRPSESAACKSRSASTIERLADSLGAAPDLRRAFLSSPRVLAVTGRT